MKAVRIKLYQNLVNYRVELSYGYVQTYPLPTPSMVRGMVHNLLGLKEYKNLKISIQGDYKSIITDLQKVYKFDRVRNEKKVDNRPKVYAGGQKSLNQGILFIDEIVDMDLVLHISFEEEDLNYKLLEAVLSKTVVLGRNEDIAYVDFENTKIVHVRSLEDEDGYRLRYNMYLAPEVCKRSQLSGTYYRLPFYYHPVNSFEDKRIFEYVDVVYITKGFKLDQGVLVEEEDDKDKYLVSFLECKISWPVYAKFNIVGKTGDEEIKR